MASTRLKTLFWRAVLLVTVAANVPLTWWAIRNVIGLARSLGAIK